MAMKVFVISDLHLSFSSDKPMDVFGDVWKDHPERIRQYWYDSVGKDDLVLIPGDISWAMKMDGALMDLEFIHGLPGKKMIIKGNHDYWWSSLSKVKKALPDSIIPLHNTAETFGDIGIAGTRLWIDPGLNMEKTSDDDVRIWNRELERLKISLRALPKGLSKRIIMTHYPPISLDGTPGRAVDAASDLGCDIWVFGHMHLGDNTDYNGFNRTIGKTRYEFASADYLEFKPKLILDKV